MQVPEGQALAPSPGLRGAVAQHVAALEADGPLVCRHLPALHALRAGALDEEVLWPPAPRLPVSLPSRPNPAMPLEGSR